MLLEILNNRGTSLCRIAHSRHTSGTHFNIYSRSIFIGSRRIELNFFDIDFYSDMDEIMDIRMKRKKVVTKKIKENKR